LAGQLVAFRVSDTGETPQIIDDAPAKEHMKPDQVLIFIDDERRRIWIWKGEKAPVRRKFIGARVAQRIRGQRGLTYKIITAEQGQEDKYLLQLVSQPPVKKRDDAAGDAAPVPPAPPTPRPTKREQPPQQPATPVVDTEESRRIRSEAARRPDYTRVVVTAERTTPRIQVQVPHSPKEIIEQVEQLKPVPGYRRELVLIGFDAFAVTEDITYMLGKKKVTRRLQRIDNLPEGTFFAQGYTPRIVIKDGQVLAIEFLKRMEEKEYQQEGSDTLRAQMKKHLADLVRFFRIEVGGQSS